LFRSLLLVGRHEGRPAQHAERGAFLGLVARRALGEGGAGKAAAHDAGCGGCRTGADYVTSGEFHRHFLLVNFSQWLCAQCVRRAAGAPWFDKAQSRFPVSPSKRWTRPASAASLIVWPGWNAWRSRKLATI